MFTTILFDLDGTLTDPKEGITKSVQYALHAMGVEQDDPDALTPFIGPPLVEQFMNTYNWDKQKAMQAVEHYRERFSTIGKFENRVYDGIETMLSTLHAQGKTLALATSKPTVFAAQILEHFSLAQYFTVVVGSELDGSRTDKGEVIAEALAQLDITNAQKQQTVMVGDRLFDVVGAKKNGLPCIGLTYGYGSREELSGADAIANTVDELLELLATPR